MVQGPGHRGEDPGYPRTEAHPRPKNSGGCASRYRRLSLCFFVLLQNPDKLWIRRFDSKTRTSVNFQSLKTKAFALHEVRLLRHKNTSKAALTELRCAR